MSFAGSAADPEDGALTGASLVWTSSRDGAIGTGTSFAKNNLSVGTHTITLTATDSQGATGTATVSITVTAPNQPPTAAISAPANNTSVGQGTNVAFSGTGSDPEDGVLSGASLVWTSSINGQIGTGVSFSTSTMSMGTHTITLTATDSKGATGTATRTVTITTGGVNLPPVPSITGPANGSTFVRGTSIAFAGTGTDPEDGALSGLSLTWRSSLGGFFGTGTSFSFSALPVGTHTITLKATDSQGATATTTRTLTITPAAGTNQAPVPVWSLPVPDTNFLLGQTVTFVGGGTDAEDGALSGASVVWSTGAIGVIGTGTTVSTNALPVGSHVVILTVTDSGGLSSYTFRTVKIQ